MAAELPSAAQIRVHGAGPLKPTTERHGTAPPSTTIDQMMDSLNSYLEKRLGLRKCNDDIQRKYNIKPSEDRLWTLPDIKKAWGKTQRMFASSRRDGWSVILCKQIRQHLEKCEIDRLKREITAENAKVKALASQLQEEKKEKERLLAENKKWLDLISKQLQSKDCDKAAASSNTHEGGAKQRRPELLYPFKELRAIEEQQHRHLLEELPHDHGSSSDGEELSNDTPAAALVTKDSSAQVKSTSTTSTKVRLAPVVIKHRRTEVEVQSEEEFEEDGQRRTRIVTKKVKRYLPCKTYQPATPEQIDKWSKELPDAYKQPRKAWQVLERLRKIYTLHPLDAAMILNVNLRDSDQNKLTESVETRAGESQDNVDAGWEAVRTFLYELKPAEVNWAKITSCTQKAGESVAEYEERFKQIWLEHAGLNNDDIGKDTGMPLKTSFVNGLKPELSKALKVRYDDWDGVGTAFNQVVEWSARIERTQDAKLRALQTNALKYNNPGTRIKTPAGGTPAPPGPFRHLQLDYITLPKCGRFQDVLVDKFSRWVEAFPTKHGTAAHTAKTLVKDIIPRWGLPECTDSDQGTHFTMCRMINTRNYIVLTDHKLQVEHKE
ncbi:uncharacterized protein LOC118789123 [Megalops cyprinoides]|uniref:uncharacterized protein LOC118789123 n=1 Tax=Megalops cyprinoides TaxID=118141 RepID=UPI001864526B|nr:uncharacterized protein LOC118789123 [Megalops cyprinoides]